MVARLSSFGFFVLLLINKIEAFLPTPFVVSPSRVIAPALSVHVSPSLLPVEELTSGFPGISPPLESSSTTLSSAVDILQTIGVVAAGIVLTLVGLAFVFSNYLIPQAAKELEEQAREKFPELWKEYQAKLDETGETLIMRPDLMQELGNKVQERLMAEFETQQMEQEQTSTETTSDTGAQPKSSGAETSVLDVEFSKEKDSE